MTEALHAIAVAFVVFSVPEVLSKVGVVYDEGRQYGIANGVSMAVKLVVQCLKCTMFWTAMALGLGFDAAALMALGAFILNRHN